MTAKALQSMHGVLQIVSGLLYGVQLAAAAAAAAAAAFSIFLSATGQSAIDALAQCLA